MEAPAGLHGVYINLDASTDRRAAMQARLDAAGLGWVRRFPATDGRSLPLPPGCILTPGQLGCLHSHLAAVTSAGDPSQWLLVLEDDAVPSADLAQALASALLQSLAGHDLVLLDCQPDCSMHTMAQLWRCLQRQLTAQRRVRGLDVVRAAGVYRWGLSAYLVSPQGRARLAAVQHANLSAGPREPNDQAVRLALEAGQLDGVVLIPFLATLAPDSDVRSTIGAVHQQDTQALAGVLRQLLFAGPVDDVLAGARGLLARPRATSAEMTVVGQVLAELFAVEAVQGDLRVDRVDRPAGTG